MTKELDTIKYLLEQCPNETIKKDLLDIETALKRLENYEQNEDFNKDVLNYAFLNEQDKIKKLKALEIIREKRVDCFKLIAIFMTSNDIKHYNQNYGSNWQLTQEEYDLLREVLL